MALQATAPSKLRYAVRRLADTPSFRSVCGFRQSLITETESEAVSLSHLHITNFSRKHYHLRTTEVYYVLDGRGVMELDDNEVEISSGDCVVIEPGCRHTARGDLKVVIIGVPPFQPDDVLFDDAIR